MVNEFIVSRVNLIFPGNDCRGGSEPIVSAPVLIPTHSGFDGLSERAAFAPVSRAETAAASRSRLGSTPPTCTVQQVGSFLRYTGRAANAAAKTADDEAAVRLRVRQSNASQTATVNLTAFLARRSQNSG